MSDIAFVIGGIGTGKTLTGVELAMLELEKGQRAVVSNISFFTGEAPEGYLTVAEWCHEFVRDPVDLARRFRKLTAEEVKDFYLHVPRFEVPVVEEVIEHRARGQLVKETQMVPDLDWRVRMQREGEVPYGTLFIIDEVHLYFSARDWQTTGSLIERYMSQLRKLNDDLILITQHPDKVDKNFRRNATLWLYLKNYGKQKLPGGVTLPGRLRVEEYLVQPQRGDKPNASRFRRISNRRYHQVYDTMAGVGISGGLAPEAQKKGGHWSRWIVIGAVVLLCCLFGPRLLMHGFVFGFHHVVGSVAEDSAGALKSFSAVGSPRGGGLNRVGAGTGVTVSGPVNGEPGSAPPAVVRGGGVMVGQVVPQLGLARRETPRWQEDVVVDGVVQEGGQLKIYLTDGTSWVYGDGHFTGWQDGVAMIDGTMYRLLTVAERVRWERRRVMGSGAEVPGSGVWGGSRGSR